LLSFLELDNSAAPPVLNHPFLFGSTKELRDEWQRGIVRGGVLAIAMPAGPMGRFLDYSPIQWLFIIRFSVCKSKKMGISRNLNRLGRVSQYRQVTTTVRFTPRF
jgi:hypothetical protein